MTTTHSLQLVLFGCLLHSASAALTRTLKSGMYDVDKKLSGECSGDISPTYYLSDDSYPCSASKGQIDRTPENKLSAYAPAVVEDKARATSFFIEKPQLRVYNIWCVTNSFGSCNDAVMYNLTITEVLGGLQCNLHFANDGEEMFRKPSKVEWLRNGNVVKNGSEKATTRDLKHEDFDTDGNLKTFSYLLPSDVSSLPGEYECKFAQDDNDPFSKVVMKAGKPKAEFMKIEPPKEQFTDGNSVNITCAFSGFPTPKVSWYQDDVALGDDTRISTKNVDGLTVSTLKIDSVEDSEDKGKYKCVAVNDAGNDTDSKALHVRDKLAPLWPFIGIVVQVIALAICIALGEKFRKKKLAKKRLLAEQAALDADK